MDSPRTVFRHTANYMNFLQHCASHPHLPTIQQQCFEEYKAKYFEDLIETVMERYPTLTHHEARNHCDSWRAHGELGFLGVYPKERKPCRTLSYTAPNQRDQAATELSGSRLHNEGSTSFTQAEKCVPSREHIADNTDPSGVAVPKEALEQPTTTVPDGTTSSGTPKHAAPRAHDTRSCSVDYSSAPGPSSLQAPSNRRRSADGGPVPPSQKDEELAQQYLSTAEAASMFQPPHRLSPTAPEFVPRSAPVGSASPPDMGSSSSSSMEGRPRRRRKDSWEDDEYLDGDEWDEA
ncbi:hypothetical protein MMC18_008637 [Xylographa bjoerkii]|nr:hypothetical protein [Xylographa bjoerkii]